MRNRENTRMSLMILKKCKQYKAIIYVFCVEFGLKEPCFRKVTAFFAVVSMEVCCCTVWSRNPCKIHSNSPGIYQGFLHKLMVTDLKYILNHLIVEADPAFDKVIKMIISIAIFQPKLGVWFEVNHDSKVWINSTLTFQECRVYRNRSLKGVQYSLMLGDCLQLLSFEATSTVRIVACMGWRK